MLWDVETKLWDVQTKPWFLRPKAWDEDVFSILWEISHGLETNVLLAVVLDWSCKIPEQRSFQLVALSMVSPLAGMFLSVKEGDKATGNRFSIEVAADSRKSH